MQTLISFAHQCLYYRILSATGWQTLEVAPNDDRDWLKFVFLVRLKESEICDISFKKFHILFYVTGIFHKTVAWPWENLITEIQKLEQHRVNINQIMLFGADNLEQFEITITSLHFWFLDISLKLIQNLIFSIPKTFAAKLVYSWQKTIRNFTNYWYHQILLQHKFRISPFLFHHILHRYSNSSLC